MNHARALLAAACLAFCAPACDAPKKETSAGPGSASARATLAPTLPASAETTAALSARPPPPPCALPACQRFDSLEAAMKVVMAEKPTLLALGESHAPRGATGVDSVTKRTTEQLLPLVASRASDFVIELWVGDPSCDRKAVAAAASQAKDVSAKQAESNPNEFVALAQAAKQAGARPHTLRPSCADYEAVRKAGPDGILVMLETVARTMGDELERLATGPHPAGRPLVVGYGGAMHNDVEPRPGRESWSYGPRLSKVQGVAYVELDLIVPEYIRDDATWRSLAWHALYDPAAEPSRFTLFRTAQKAFTLVFPRTGEGAPR